MKAIPALLKPMSTANIIDSGLQAHLASLSRENIVFWSFRDKATREHCHGYFQYPAMMAPQMQWIFIKAAIKHQQGIEWVFDPSRNEDFNGSFFKIAGKANFNFFRPNVKKELPEFGALVESDDGDEFFKFLSSRKQAKSFSIKRSDDPRWFVEFKITREFEGLDHLALLNDRPANPGKFFGEVDGFDLGHESVKRQNVFDRPAEFKKIIKDISGIRVYRDSFGIRVDRDWLGLGKQWSDAGSYYGLKPNTTLGFIALTARENINLEETTDREGFKVSPYYDNFFNLLEKFKDFTQDAHEFLRRCWVEFRKTHNEALAGIEAPIEPEDLSRKIQSGLSKAAVHKKELVKSERASDQGNEFHQQTIELQGPKQDIIDYLDELSGMEAAEQVLEDSILGFKRQITDMYATVALGLTAEALSHEIYQIADRLAQRTSNLNAYLKRKTIKDPSIISFVEYVKTSINALRKQIAHLSPSLKYVREKKEKLLMSGHLTDVVKEYYKDKFARKKIEINVPNKKDFTVYTNKGKLTQIFDNLILNSEYWLTEDIRRKRLSNGNITIEIDKPFIRVSDNGPGIERSIESTVFEPFVTDKGRAKGQEKGRGLGLFIVRQLLDSDGCYISILSRRNKHDRFYFFQIDLRGIIDANA